MEGAGLLLDLHRNYGAMLDGIGWNGAQQVRALMQSAVTDVNVRNSFSGADFGFFSGTAVGTEGDDAFAGDADANSFSAGAGNDLIDGLGGNDNLAGGAGDDLLFAGAGDDIDRKSVV